MNGIAIRIEQVLREKGIDDTLARALADALGTVFFEAYTNAATKDDMKTLRNDLKMLVEMFNKRFEDLLRHMEMMQNNFNKRLEDILRRLDTICNMVLINVLKTFIIILTSVLKR